MKDDQPRPPIGMAALVALAIVALSGGIWFMLGGATAMASSACQDAAEYHFQRSTVDDEESSYHYRAGQAYLVLQSLKADCTNWQETEKPMNTQTQES